MKYLILILGALFFISSCKKDEEPNLCKNGFKDIGEVGVDCGGPCPECEMVFLPDLRMKLNGTVVPFQVKTFEELNNTWFLNFSNDSIQVQLEIGQTMVSDSNYVLAQANSFAIIDGISYPFITNLNSVCAITEIFEDEERISGLFNVQFYRTGFIDTMKITSGEFIHLPY